MKIDAVYTWVNHKDPAWQKQYNEHVAYETKACHPSATALSRYHNRNEIYYSVKSIKKYAPWINRIYIVSNCSLPSEVANLDQVVFVPHEDIFEDKTSLPTFNSRAIECNLHKIEGLSEQYLYFNDDMFLCQPTAKEDFFPDESHHYVFKSKHLVLSDTSQFRPIDFGIRNAKAILEKDHGVSVDFKLEHSPYPVQKSLIFELESLYKEHFTLTSSNKFRSKMDVPVSTTLSAYYSLSKGVATPRDVACRYVDISHPLFPLLTWRLSPLRRGKYLSLCLNEVEPIKYLPNVRDIYLTHVMRKMFN